MHTHLEDEEQEQEVKTGSRPFLRILFMLVLLLGLTGLLLLALTGLEPGNAMAVGWQGFWSNVEASFREKPPQETMLVTLPETDSVLVMAVQGEALVFCTSGELRSLDADGVERWIRPVELETPFLTADSRDVLYADLSGRTFGVVRDGTQFFEKHVDRRIYHASLSRDFILLLTSGNETGYAGVFEGYSREGGAVFTSWLTEYTPFASFHAPETGQSSLILTGLSTSRLQAGGVVSFLSPDLTKLGGVSAEDDLFPVVLQLNNGSTVLVGEKELRMVDGDLFASGHYKPEGDTITAAALLDGMYPVLSVLDRKRYETMHQEKSWVRILNSDGTLRHELLQDGRVRKIITAPNLLGLVLEREIVFLDGNGTLLTTFSAREAVVDAVMTRRGIAYIHADGQLVSYRVKTASGFFGMFR